MSLCSREGSYFRVRWREDVRFYQSQRVYVLRVDMKSHVSCFFGISWLSSRLDHSSLKRKNPARTYMGMHAPCEIRTTETSVTTSSVLSGNNPVRRPMVGGFAPAFLQLSCARCVSLASLKVCYRRGPYIRFRLGSCPNLGSYTEKKDGNACTRSVDLLLYAGTERIRAAFVLLLLQLQRKKKKFLFCFHHMEPI